jgi:hypothetical protein
LADKPDQGSGTASPDSAEVRRYDDLASRTRIEDLVDGIDPAAALARSTCGTEEVMVMNDRKTNNATSSEGHWY